jgi:hypothetical protein
LAKSSDDTNFKLKELALQVLRNLYFSLKCPNLKDRLDKLRVVEITQFGMQNEEAQKGEKGKKETAAKKHKSLIK